MTGTVPPAKPSRANPPTRTSRRLGGRGVAAAEFALIAIPFFIVIIGCMEVGWQLATGAALDHAALRASRYGITGSDTPPAWMTDGQQDVPTCRSQNLPWLVTRSTGGLLRSANLTVTTANWSNVATVSGTGTENAGTGGRIVAYTLAYQQPFITGIVGTTLFGGTSLTHRAFLMVKNEPFENAPC